MSTSLNILLGVVGGVLTSGFLFFLSVIFRKIVFPWYQDLIYRGINIEDIWECETEFDITMEYSLLTIKQVANKFTGNCILTSENKETNEKEIRTFNCSGQIRDRLVIINQIISNNKQIGISTELLEIIGDGKTMKGKGIWYSISNETILSGDSEWRRKK